MFNFLDKILSWVDPVKDNININETKNDTTVIAQEKKPTPKSTKVAATKTGTAKAKTGTAKAKTTTNKTRKTKEK